MALNGLITAVIAQTFNSIAELVISIGIPIKEKKAEMETSSNYISLNKKMFNIS